MFTRSRNRHRVFALARTLIVVALIVALLSGTVPYDTVSSAGMCAMTCCAGKVSHASGSCSGSSCHASFQTKRKAKKPQADPICGANSLTNKSIDVFYLLELEHVNHSEHGTSPSIGTSGSFSKPCPSDCSALGISSTGRQTFGQFLYPLSLRPRPPNPILESHYSYGSLKYISALLKQSRPRAPPILSF
jgi:hypothetical protein